MNKMLFHRVNETLSDEIVKQLSDIARPMCLDQSLDMNDLYRINSYRTCIPPREIAMIRQVRDLAKRYIGKPKQSNIKIDRDQVCWNKFQAANRICGLQNSNFHNLDPGIMNVLELARQKIAKAFWHQTELDSFPFTWTESPDKTVDSLLFPVEGFDMGPGTCQGIEGVSILEKLVLSDWTSSSEHASAYLKLITRMWRASRHWGITVKEFPVSHVLKPSFVPKDTDISRLILPQNNGDLLLQYPAGVLLESMLKEFGIDLALQQGINRTLARLGSLYDNLDVFDFSLYKRTLRPCTIDLSSASDIVGIELVKFLMPYPLFKYMDMCRSKSAEYKDDVVHLNMFANMGNAFCFPLQTIVFASIVEAIYELNGQPTSVDGTRTYSVFGDDIIVDVSVYDDVIRTLKHLEMIPNQKKSFSFGFFRESCGMDFFSGYDTRPVFCEKLRDDCDLYSLANQLLDWGTRHSVCVAKTVSLILRNVRVKTIVPMDSATTDGLRVPESALVMTPRKWLLNYKVSICLEGRNSYLLHSFVVRKRATIKKTIRVHNDVRTCMTFLKGGVRQLDKRGYSFAVNSDVVCITSEFTDRSQWDVPIQDESGLPVTKLNKTNCYGTLTFLLAKVFALVSAPLNS